MTPMDFRSVLETFAYPDPIPVWDTTGSRDPSGVWRESDPVPRGTIRAIVLGLTTRDLEIYPEGEASQGGISLTTDAELYFSDVVDTGGGQETRQSYVEFQGRRYRVTGSALLYGNTAHHIYHALRSIR